MCGSPTPVVRKTIIEELEETIAGQAIASRAEKLRRLSDLFLECPSDRIDDEVAVFDDVMTRLIDEMEVSVRSELARRFAAISNAPVKLMRILAADHAIEVAGPVLTNSPCLDDATLVEQARTKGQPHLLAISRRDTIDEIVTDVLVERGDRAVALSTAANAGARLSEGGRTILVDRAKDDHELASSVWSRSDIPHHHLLRLFTIATENVRRSLETADRQKTAFIRDMVGEVANRMQARIRDRSPDYEAAHKVVGDLHRVGGLGVNQLEAFAMEGRFDESTVALSIMCDLPLGAVERAMVQDRAEPVVLLARAIGLSWTCTGAILRLRAGTGGLSAHEVDEAWTAFNKLRPETARTALQFLRLRERATSDPTHRPPGAAE